MARQMSENATVVHRVIVTVGIAGLTKIYGPYEKLGVARNILKRETVSSYSGEPFTARDGTEYAGKIQRAELVWEDVE